MKENVYNGHPTAETSHFIKPQDPVISQKNYKLCNIFCCCVKYSNTEAGVDFRKEGDKAGVGIIISSPLPLPPSIRHCPSMY